MSSRKTIQNELRSLNSRLPLTVSPSFSVPEGYFESLAATILASVKRAEANTSKAELNELSPLLAGIARAMPYSVPSFYFDENLQNTPVSQTEMESPVLPAVGKVLPYDVPEGYFDGLPERILAKLNGPKAKVVPLFRRTWMRVAAAAVITGGLLIGGLQIFSGKGAGNEIAENNTDTTSKLIAQVTPPIQQEIKNASTKDLEEFIQKAAPATARSLSKKEASEKEASALLKDVSVSDMEDFLSAVPQTDEELFASDEP